MPLKQGYSRGAVSSNIREMIDAGHPQNQAVAAALRVADQVRRRKRRADGGDATDSTAPDPDDLPDVGPPLIPSGPTWPGTDIGNRAADIGSRFVQEQIDNAASLPRRAIENSAYSLDSGTYDPSTSVETAGAMMGGASPFAGVSDAGETALGVVPVDAARAFGIRSRMPDTPEFAAAVRNTPGAAVDQDALTLPVSRNQKPDQELEQSVRGGVFYLPQGSANQSMYGSARNPDYGGSQPITGDTAYKAPLFVKGATGGKAPEAAYKQLRGKDAFADMQQDTWRSTPPAGPHLSSSDRIDLVRQFLDKHAPELSDAAGTIYRNSQKGNQLRYALQEAAIGSAARQAGHDAIIGYSTRRTGTKEPFISEIFDTRESHYPGTAGEYEMFPSTMFGGQRAGGGKVARAGGGKVARALRVAKAAGGPVFDGYIHGSTGGRTDNKNINVESGSYVVPADVLSGLGEGNSMAGADNLMRQLEMGPYDPDDPANQLAAGVAASRAARAGATHEAMAQVARDAVQAGGARHLASAASAASPARMPVGKAGGGPMFGQGAATMAPRAPSLHRPMNFPTPPMSRPGMRAMTPGAPAASGMPGQGGQMSRPQRPAVPIVAASGEMVVPPHKVARLGGGDLDRGHNILDAMVKHVRRQTIKTLKGLPKPKRD